MQLRAEHRQQLVAVGAALLLGACAPGSPFAAADPSDATVRVTEQPYRSPFEGQTRFQIVEPRPWRETNDLVGRLGGPGPHMKPDADEVPAKAAP